MKTCIHNKIDLQQYMNTLDFSKVPSEEDIEKAMIKHLVTSFITLRSLGKEDILKVGDTVKLNLESTIPKYNKPKLTLMLGSKLFLPIVEKAVIGKRIGEAGQVIVDNESVNYKILEASRRVVPELSDEMVIAKGIEGVRTIDEYRNYLTQQMTIEGLRDLTGEMVESMMENSDIDEPAEEDIEGIIKAAFEMFCKKYKEDTGRNLEELPSEEFEKLFRCKNVDEYFAVKRSQKKWNRYQIHRTLVMLSALGLECKGENSPFENYENYMRLFRKVVAKVEEEWKERKNNGNTGC